jgi:hypothetical protein
MGQKGLEQKQDEFLKEIELQFGLTEEQQAAYQDYAKRPVEFIESELHFTLTDEQKQICTGVRDDRETNVQASHGCGKTFLAACLCLWWILCVGGLCITTAPTKRQVIELLWGEIRKTHSRLDLPGDRGQTFLRLTEEARGFGFTASDRNSNAFQGVHHEFLLVIEDEACGISNEIDEGASSCVTGAGNRFLRIGNPIATGGAFEKACKRRHIRIPVWGHPNVIWAYEIHSDGIHRLKPEVAAAILNEAGEVKPQSEWAAWCPRDKIPGAVSIAWIEDVRAKYGEGSAYWQSRVEGFFPEDSAQSIVPRSWFLKARARYDADPKHWDEQAAAHDWRHGLDVGDGGDDHAHARWRGAVLYAVRAMPTKGDQEDVTRAGGMAIAALQSHPGFMHIDRGGCGAGVPGMVKEQGLKAHGVHWGEGAKDSAQFPNSKAEDFWSLREAFRKDEVAIAPLGDYEEMAMEDLAGVYWELTSKGQTRMEDKEKTKKRLHRSPNVGDAIVIGFRQPQRMGMRGAGVQVY